VSILWRKRYLINSCGIPLSSATVGLCIRVCSQRFAAGSQHTLAGGLQEPGWPVCNQQSLSNDAVEGARIAG
jgi:hypothetical protein